MSEQERRLAHERRLRRAAVTAVSQQAVEVSEDDLDAEDQAAAAKRMDQQALWVDRQVRRAMDRGDFDNLPGAGKPIRGLGGTHDPNWWVKNLIEREQITGVLPPALGLRNEDAELEDTLDRETTEKGVRRIVDEFNQRVIQARRQLQGGPPVITPLREIDAEIAAWQARRDARIERLRRQREEAAAATAAAVRPGWFARWRRSKRGHAG